VDPGERLAQIDWINYKQMVESKQYALKQSLAQLGLNDLPGSGFDIKNVATVQRAQVQFDNAVSKFNRADQMMKGPNPPLSKQDYEDTETAKNVAAASLQVEVLNANRLLAEVYSKQKDLEIAQKSLSDTTVYAPEKWGVSNGSSTTLPSTGPSTAPVAEAATQHVRRHFVVVSRQISVGQYVREGTPLYTLMVDDPIKLIAHVPQQYSSMIQEGQRAAIRFNGKLYNGVVSVVNKELDEKSRTFDVHIQIDNRSHELKSKSFASGEIFIGGPVNVLAVPKDAVVTFAGETRIFRVKDRKANDQQVESGKASAQKVELGQELDGGKFIEVTQLEGKPVDLSQPDVLSGVVVTGNSLLADGVTVELGKPPATVPTAPAVSSAGQ
jgi:hypothetical protein